MVWLLIALFSLINLSSTADIIYSKKYNAEKTDIIYLKSGKKIEGRVVRDPLGSRSSLRLQKVDPNAEQVKIEVESTQNLAAINLEEPEPVRIEVIRPNRNVGPFSRSASNHYTNHGTTAKIKKYLLTYQSDEVEKVVLHQSKPTSTFQKVLIGLGCCCLGSAGVLLYLFNEAMSGLASPLG